MPLSVAFHYVSFRFVLFSFRFCLALLLFAFLSFTKIHKTIWLIIYSVVYFFLLVFFVRFFLLLMYFCGCKVGSLKVLLLQFWDDKGGLKP